VRKRSEGDQGAKPVSEVIAQMKAEIEAKE
jgi:threonyl-tRNA synthetase